MLQVYFISLLFIALLASHVDCQTAPPGEQGDEVSVTSPLFPSFMDLKTMSFFIPGNQFERG